MEPLLERVVLPAGAVIALAGGPSDRVWFPAGAIVSAVVRLANGENVEAALIGTEGFVGFDVLFGVTSAPITCVVQVGGAVVSVRADALGPRFERFPNLRDGALRFGSAMLGSIAQVAACNATHSLRQRMARWLLMAHDRSPSDRIRLTHDFIATMINVRRAGVSQFASELRSAGAITYTRGDVRILDRTLLERESCECYGAIRQAMRT